MINAVIDMSHHNNVSSFTSIREAGIFGIIHKASQGAVYTDPTFADHRQAAIAAGLQVGAYHFGIAGDAVAQADHLLAVAGAESLLVLDFEANTQGQSMSLGEAELFVHHIKQVTGRYPGLYSGNTIKEAISGAGITSPAQTELSNCWLWLAQYGTAPLVPKIWTNWTLWQYTDGAAGVGPYDVAGVGRCDREQFNGTLEELTAFWASHSGSAW